MKTMPAIIAFPGVDDVNAQWPVLCLVGNTTLILLVLLTVAGAARALRSTRTLFPFHLDTGVSRNL